MRPRRSALVVVGFASSVTASVAVLPPSQPMESDTVMLLLVWATAALAADGLARTGQTGAVTAVALVLTVTCLAAVGVASARERRWEQPGILLALLAVDLVSLLPAVRATVAAAAGAGPGRPAPLLATGGPTRALPPEPPGRRVLHGRWLLEPVPMAGADQGGFSVLYRAADLRRQGRTVVVKLASRSFGVDDDSVARLRREGETIAGLDSPHVVRLLDSGWDGGALFLVLDYHPAGSLARWLERRFVLELSRAAEATRELLRALAYLHEGIERAVVHRDVTPRNVLLRSERPRLRLLLTDFGSARRLQADGPTTEASITVGSVFSPYYAPPELVGGSHHGWWGPQTDVYSACAILYELLTGLPPYQREARRRNVDFQRLVLDPAATPAPPGRIVVGLPRILDDVIAAGLAHDPGMRPARAADLLPLLGEIGRRHGSLRIPFADLRSRP
jgi:hypothetical protein